MKYEMIERVLSCTPLVIKTIKSRRLGFNIEKHKRERNCWWIDLNDENRKIFVKNMDEEYIKDCLNYISDRLQDEVLGSKNGLYLSEWKKIFINELKYRKHYYGK